MSQQINNFPNDMFPARTIARPIKNLGNTCYMNAVLQALAHAPELCLAMDCEPHHLTCPIAAENFARQHRAASGESSPSSSPDNTTSNNNNNNNAAATAAAAASRKTTGTRKSLRSGRKSPLEDQEETKRRRLQFCALCEVEKHVKKVHDSTLKDKPVAPSTFVDGFIDFVAPWFKPGVQEDSHEFLRLLIDSMQKSCERARVSSSSSLVQQDNPQDDSPTSARPPSAAAHGGDDKDSEYPFSLFRGTVESIVTCESCKAVSSTLDPIEDIGLEATMPTSSNSGTTATTLSMDNRSSRNSSPTPAPALADVQTAFQRFARAEPLDAGYKCEKCGLVGRATKQSRLASIPPILTLHLKRFRYGTGDASMMSSSVSAAGGGANNSNNNNTTTSSSSTVATRRTPRSEVGQLLGSTHSDFKSGSAKIEGNIKFQELFDLKPYLTDELQSQHINMLCRLFAVIVHAGKNSHSGHYIAYVRSLSKATTKNNEWWKMDDGRVTPASQQEVLRSEAYMLFYRVVQHPVAARLEQEYKVKVAAATAALNKEPHMNTDDDDDDLPEPAIAGTMTPEAVVAAAAVAAAAVVASSSSVTIPRRSPRKRLAPPEFETGEEWARAKTTFPPPIIDFLKKVQDHCFSDKVVWAKQFIQNVLEMETSKENARVGKYPKNIISANVDDLEGGADAIRVQLRRLCKSLAEVFEKEELLDTLMSYLTEKKIVSLNKKNEEVATTSTTTNTATNKISTSTLTGTDEKRVAVVEPEEEMALL